MNFTLYAPLLAPVTSSHCNILGKAGASPYGGFREPCSMAPMGLSTDLMPLVNEVASHTHRPVLGCLDLPCANGAALLALPTGLSPNGALCWGRVKHGGMERDHILGMQVLQLKDPTQKKLENRLIYVYAMIF